MARRDAEQTAGGKPEKKVKRARVKKSRAWEKLHNPAVASYRLTVELKQAIRNLAAELGVSPAVVVEKFLETGLELYRDGKIKFK
jgi:hypothetical protein